VELADDALISVLLGMMRPEDSLLITDVKFAAVTGINSDMFAAERGEAAWCVLGVAEDALLVSTEVILMFDSMEPASIRKPTDPSDLFVPDEL
jgi:hypothetical protein